MHPTKRYELTDEAKADLIRIRRFTTQHWGKAQSATYLRNLRERLVKLAEFPYVGKSRQYEFTGELYSIPYVSHLVYYQIREAPLPLLVLAILHHSRVPDQLLDARVGHLPTESD